jgi:uncharacterized protein
MTGSGFLGAAARQAQLVEDVSGRPWPLPDEPWAQAQTRENVLFAHWPVALPELARLLPPGLPVDTFDGEAWVGIVPFRLVNLRLRGLPPLPWLSSFLQLDVRTYLTVDGRPGIWLFSLDTTNPLLVEAAKRAHRLPAYRARISSEAVEGGLRFEASRNGLAFRARYAGAGKPFTARGGTLEHFLTERYCLYTADGGRLYRADLHQAAWSLQAGEADVEETTISPLSLEGEPHLLFAASHDVLVWPLEEL